MGTHRAQQRGPLRSQLPSSLALGSGAGRCVDEAAWPRPERAGALQTAESATSPRQVNRPQAVLRASSRVGGVGGPGTPKTGAVMGPDKVNGGGDQKMEVVLEVRGSHMVKSR
jgi:hypothetical protein